jgi:hypothetical protein
MTAMASDIARTSRSMATYCYCPTRDLGPSAKRSPEHEQYTVSTAHHLPRRETRPIREEHHEPAV